MINHKEDSIAAMKEREAAEINKDETIELLKGCIMELAEVIYGDGGAQA